MIPIPDHDGYFATADGNIYSARRDKILKGSINMDGYLTVFIYCKDGKRRKMLVHRLVASAYHYNDYQHGLVVRHLNGDPLNNHPDNLSYGTQYDNYMDAVKHGTRATGKGVDAHITKPETIRLIRQYLQQGVRNIDISRMFGISTAQVSRIKYGKRHKKLIDAELLNCLSS